MSPGITKESMAQGPWVAPDLKVRRRYGKADAGPRCSICTFPLVRQLSDAGERTHPTCDPEHVEWLEALNRALRRRPAQDTPPPPPADVVTPSSPGSITAPQLRRLHVMLGEAGITRRDRQLAFYTDTCHRDVTTSKDLSKHEASLVMDALERLAAPDTR